MKNETKHTPGPWEVHKSRIIKNGSKFSILHPLINGPDADPQYVGKLGGYHIVMGPQNCEPGYILNEADAALIAAAPELLAALEKVVDVHDNGTFKGQMFAAMTQARASIAKAKGE